MKIIKYLYGYSNSQLVLAEYADGRHFVRKYGNPSRNIERMEALNKLGIRVPEIYYKAEDYFDMEYVHGIDMKTYLFRYPVENLISFLKEVYGTLTYREKMKDYSEVYRQKTDFLSADRQYYTDKLPFTQDELLSKLNEFAPETEYVGDLTLDNILFDGRNFILLDPVTIEYDSKFFDIAKLHQDITCGWFLRNEKDNHLWSKLAKIREDIKQVCICPPVYIIMMLLRILPYARIKSKTDEQWLYTRIKELWQKEE